MAPGTVERHPEPLAALAPAPSTRGTIVSGPRHYPPMAERRQVKIRGDMIRLGQLLKLADVVDSGGEVRDLLDSEEVRVNGEPEFRRGRQLRNGDVITVIDVTLEIVATDAQ